MDYGLDLKTQTKSIIHNPYSIHNSFIPNIDKWCYTSINGAIHLSMFGINELWIEYGLWIMDWIWIMD